MFGVHIGSNCVITELVNNVIEGQFYKGIIGK